MSEDAPILEDVAEEETVESEEEEQHLSDRDAVVNRIRENRKEEILEEISLSEESEVIEEPAEEESEEPEDVETLEVEDVETLEVEDEPEEEAPRTITVKVNGEDVDVPLDKVMEAGVKTYQKESAADIKLRQASVKEKELAQREAKINEIIQAQVKKEKLQSHGDFKKAVATALVEDEGKAAEMITDRLAQLDEIEERINVLQQGVVESTSYVETQKVAEGQRLQNLFKDNFPELASDKNLKDAANRVTQVLLQQDPNRPHEEIVLEAGKRVREHYASVFGSAGKVEKTPRSLKQSMPKQVKRVAMKREAPPEKRPRTRQEIIQDAIKARSPV